MNVYIKRHGNVIDLMRGKGIIKTLKPVKGTRHYKVTFEDKTHVFVIENGVDALMKMFKVNKPSELAGVLLFFNRDPRDYDVIYTLLSARRI